MNNHITIQRQLLCCLFRENRSMNRENFQSRLGFILVSAGCAIGIGNVWRFPYVAGQNGGGVFVLFYLIFLLCMGVPVLTMELAVGRAGDRKSTRLNSSHRCISYAVFCLKKRNTVQYKQIT